MAFTDNNDRHSFPHRISTGYEINGVTVGPSEITFDYLDGSILSTNMEDGVKKTRRLRREIRMFTFKYLPLRRVIWNINSAVRLISKSSTFLFKCAKNLKFTAFYF